MRKGESQECHGMTAGPEKKNFSISKLQSNILTLTDWPPFVIGTPKRDDARKRSASQAECVLPLLLFLLHSSSFLCKHQELLVNRIPQSIY